VSAPRRIEVEIEELVLHGFDPRDRHSIGKAVRSELSRLLTEGGVPSSLGHAGNVPHLDGGSFGVRRGTTPKAVGSQVARAVYGGMRK
jgi:hypothetical protein